MTVSEHVYTAVLSGVSPQTLRVHEDAGSIDFDVDRTPHVGGRLRLTGANEDLLAAIDARQSPPPRVVVDVTAEFPSGVQTSTFDLTVRGHDRDQDNGEPVLELASDEALLDDYRTLADDLTPLTHQDSLRDLVGYTIDKAIPGASLEPGDDVAVPALSDADNVVRNPKVASDTVDWGITGSAAVNRETSGGPAGISATYYRAVPTSGATGVAIHIDENTVAVRADTNYKLIAYVYAQSTQSVTLDCWVIDANGTVIGSATPVSVVPAGSWVKLVCPFYTRDTGAKIRPRLSVDGAALALTVGFTAVRVSVDSGDPGDDEPFDGDTADTALYGHEWTNTPNASSSRRVALIDAATPAALTWKAGDSALEFLAPIVQRFGLRLVCDETRAWTLRDAEHTVEGSVTIRYAVNMTRGSERVSRDDDIWCDACVVIYKWTDAAGVQRTRVDSYSMVGSPTKVRRITKDAPYPGPGFAQYVVERAQGRGRVVSAGMVANWGTRPEQLASIRLSGSPDQTGSVQRVSFDLSNDEMTVSARTTDTSTDAWLLDDDGPWLDIDPDEPWEV